MKRISGVLHLTLGAVAIVGMAGYWTLMIAYGRGSWLNLEGRYAVWSPISFTLLSLLLASAICIPVALLSSMRTAQWLLPRWNLFAGWAGLRSTSNAFATVGLILLIPTLVLVTPVREIAAKAGLSKGAAPERPALTDESIDYPAFPLIPADHYAWNVKNLKGDAVNMAQFKGAPLFLNFWATWCGPCRAEMPSIQRLYKAMKDKNVQFAFVTNEATEPVAKFLKEQGYDLPVYFIEGKPPRALQSNGIPATFIITAQGELAYQHTGCAAWDTDKTLAFLAQLTGPGPIATTP